MNTDIHEYTSIYIFVNICCSSEIPLFAGPGLRIERIGRWGSCKDKSCQKQQFEVVSWERYRRSNGQNDYCFGSFHELVRGVQAAVNGHRPAIQCSGEDSPSSGNFEIDISQEVRSVWLALMCTSKTVLYYTSWLLIYISIYRNICCNALSCMVYTCMYWYILTNDPMQVRHLVGGSSSFICSDIFRCEFWCTGGGRTAPVRQGSTVTNFISRQSSISPTTRRSGTFKFSIFTREDRQWRKLLIHLLKNTETNKTNSRGQGDKVWNVFILLCCIV